MSEDLGLELSWAPLERARALLEGALEDLGRTVVPAAAAWAWGGADEAPPLAAQHERSAAAHVDLVVAVRRDLAGVVEGLLTLRRCVEQRERDGEAGLRERQRAMARECR